MAAKVAPSAKVARQPVVGSSYPLTTSFTASLTLHLPPMFRPSRSSITLLGSCDSQLQFFAYPHGSLVSCLAYPFEARVVLVVR